MHILFSLLFSFFFFNDTATTEIYTLSLHDALPISRRRWRMIDHTLSPYAAASVPYRRYATLGSPTPRRDARLVPARKRRIGAPRVRPRARYAAGCTAPTLHIAMHAGPSTA